MSEAADREQAASPRRRQQARQRGQVARSPEFIFAVVYAACGAVCVACGPSWLAVLRERLRGELISAAEPLTDPLGYVQRGLLELGWWLFPCMLVILLGVVVAHWVQHGPLWLPDRLQWDLGRIHPTHGLQRFFQADTWVNFGMSGIKIGLLVLLAFWLFRSQWAAVQELPSTEADLLPAALATLLSRFGAWIGMGLLIWGGVDFAWQLYRHERQLRMSPEELRDEIRAVHNDVSSMRHRQQRAR